MHETGHKESNYGTLQTSLSSQSPKRRSRWDRQPSDPTSIGLGRSTEPALAEKRKADAGTSSSDEDTTERVRSSRRTRWDQERR